MGRTRFRFIFTALWVTALSVLSSAESFRTKQAVAADDTLRAAGKYVSQYERAIQGVVAQEDYQQVVVPMRPGAPSPAARRLRSDLLVLNGGRFGWIAFRDVFEVDGHPVREREERLSRLLGQVTPDSLQQARRLAAESGRFNLNATGVVLDRTINTPMVALQFLRLPDQRRSVFKARKTNQIDGLTCVALSFNEQAKPALIGSNADAKTQGTFWIDVETGRVVQSELRIESVVSTKLFVRSRIMVKYAPVAKLDLWLPASMDELYELEPSMQAIRGYAVYSDFRQFKVTTSEGVK